MSQTAAGLPNRQPIRKRGPHGGIDVPDRADRTPILSGAAPARKRKGRLPFGSRPFDEEGRGPRGPRPSNPLSSPEARAEACYLPVTATFLLYPTGRVMPEKVYGPNLARSVDLPLVTFHLPE
jgi:hypothetical protein